ncbi:inorganic phosphate transporter [Candidatus Berkiella cookevillensis]|uniref:Inorganic phosphate transporter n=1 Tax=Candidatus Berkiella cookevillensis TaxID=437022 RepID=A0A0Q9YIV0_9GAMM|nr:inorganic phosphate transporter [Candidatus Berkiella cookevillensis]MCS5707606.1 inorganic phosphate transporter [Candidatus Berkiella cookevillensis]
MELAFLLFISIVVLAIIFDYINGFHDAANAIATVVSTKVLSPRIAVIYGASLNVVGALLGTQVATTIGTGLVETQAVTSQVLLSALVSAIVWNLLTWFKGLPSSSSHALMGSLMGATAFAAGSSSLHWDKIIEKVIIPTFSSPIIGLVLGYFVMVALYWLLHKVSLPIVNRWFSKLQIISAGYMAITHGANDAQKTMGIIALAVATYYQTPFHVSAWIIIVCALAMGLGTVAGGWKIIRTVGSKMVKLKPLQGFAAEATGGTILFLTAHLGIPVSTTHTITTSIMGVGSAQRFSALRPKVVMNIMAAWVVTLPTTFFLAGGLFWLMQKCFTLP